MTYRRSDYIAAVIRTANDDGTLTATEYESRRREDEPSLPRVMQVFGWNELLTEAGLRPTRVHKGRRKDRVSSEDMVAAIRRVADEHGGRLTYNDYLERARALGLPSGVSVRTRFGSWNIALEAAGLDIVHDYTRDYIIEEDLG
jgi:hypothetical protein